jgi:hypothetical protein
MNTSSLSIFSLISLTLLLYGCGGKKNTNTPVSPLQASTLAMPMLPTTSTSEPTAQPQALSIGITTKPGFLGKPVNNPENDKAILATFNKDFEKKVAAANKYYDFKFDLHNVSGVSLYTTCFAYVKPGDFNRWRWRKTEVKEVKPGATIPISMRILDDHQDKFHVFGALGVFSNRIEAEESTYELLPDENKLDLDLLSEIEKKTIVVGIERYGFREPFYDYDFVEKQAKENGATSELDFFVQNQTGRTTFVTGFIYSKKAKGRWIAAEDEKDDMSVWRFYKTKVLRLEQGQTGYIDIDSIIPKRDRSFVRGYLGVFDEDHENDAHSKTFELLSDAEKINLGLLTRREGRTIILEVERYGVANDVINFTVKPIRWIDFKKIVR